jgi:hypothetical protein
VDLSSSVFLEPTFKKNNIVFDPREKMGLCVEDRSVNKWLP